MAKAVHMVLGSSYFLARRSQVQLLACKVNTESIWRQDVPPSRIFLVLGSFSLHVNNLYDSQLKSSTKTLKMLEKIFSLLKRPSVILKEFILKLNTELLRREKTPKTIPLRDKSA